ncbi:MAG: hypothetical protein ACYDAX_05405, partial [Desulfobacteria bacterium]
FILFAIGGEVMGEGWGLTHAARGICSIPIGYGCEMDYLLKSCLTNRRQVTSLLNFGVEEEGNTQPHVAGERIPLLETGSRVRIAPPQLPGCWCDRLRKKIDVG